VNGPPARPEYRLARQVALEAGTTPHQVRLAMTLHGIAARGAPLEDAVRALGRSPVTVKRIARRWLIDLADYRPFARRKARPAPAGALAFPTSSTTTTTERTDHE